jgi:hypothetical protein
MSGTQCGAGGAQSPRDRDRLIERTVTPKTDRGQFV